MRQHKGDVLKHRMSDVDCRIKKDYPGVQVASIRFNKYMKKSGSVVAEDVKQIVICVASEAVMEPIRGAYTTELEYQLIFSGKLIGKGYNFSA